MLPLEGRIILLNAILSALPLYYMSFYVLPGWVQVRIDNIRCRFFWRGLDENNQKYHLVSWRHICRLKQEGGLGVFDTRIFNLVLMVKWWWRLLSHLERTVERFLLSKYGPRSGSQHSRLRNSSNTSLFWKGVLVSKCLLWPSVKFKIGKENKVLFWCDRQCSEVLLKDLYLTLYQVTRHKEVSIKKYWHRNR